MENLVTITYRKQTVEVSREVAEFLKQDTRRWKAQRRSDRRHLVRSRMDPDVMLETALIAESNYVLDVVIKLLEAETVREAVTKLSEEDCLLVRYRYYGELTQQEIADILGISKMAVCKRLKKLHERLEALLPAFRFIWARIQSFCRAIYRHLVYRRRFCVPVI